MSRLGIHSFKGKNPNRFSLLRSLLFIPGNSEKMLNKSFNLRCDAFVPDLEDSVPMDRKTEARTTVRKFILNNWASYIEQLMLEAESQQKIDKLVLPRLIPRVNSELEFLEKDIEALCSNPYVDAITVGKCETEEQMDQIFEILSKIEQKNGLEKESIKVIPTIETALGVVNMFSICDEYKERVVGLAFGGDDYARDMGFTRKVTQFEPELLYVRSEIAVITRACNILSLDTPHVNLKDTEGLLNECKSVRGLGFKGKFAIHPTQIGTINQTFGVSDEEALYAKKVIDLYEENQKTGSGALTVDNRMVDVPVYRRYKNVYASYEKQKAMEVTVLEEKTWQQFLKKQEEKLAQQQSNASTTQATSEKKE